MSKLLKASKRGMWWWDSKQANRASRATRAVIRTPFLIIPVFATTLAWAMKRLKSNISLALCALIALVASVAISVSIPVYAEGASLRLLKQQLAQKEEQSGRSAFSLLFRYVGAWNEPLDWERIAPADAYLSGPALERLALPLEGLGRHARTAQLPLYFPTDGQQQQGRQKLTDVSLGFVSGLDDRIRILDGALPTPASSRDDPIEVMVMREFANRVGINVGDRFTVVAQSGGQTVSLPIRIAATWDAINPNDPAWFFQPDAFREVFLLPEETFTTVVAESLKQEVGQMLWFVRLHGEQVTVSEASPMLSRIERVRAESSGMIQGLKLEQSPIDALQQYRADARELTIQLAVLSVPVFGLVFYFTSLVATLLVNRQRGEIALLKTRGVHDGYILGVYVTEWVLMGVCALLIGPTLGLFFATLMGRTDSFLSLSPDMTDLSVSLTWESVRFGVIAVLLAIGAAVVPALAATRRTLVDEQQQAARNIRPPFWQRFYLDILLLLPPGYGIYQMQRGGGLSLGGATSADPLSNPLPALVPVFLCFALGLVAVRVIPMALELLARLSRLPSWLAPLIALRSLARQPASYRGPLLLLILTLSLAAFSASMAATLDGSLHAAMRYHVAAETQLIETGQSTEEQSGQDEQPERKNIEEEARFLFIPVSDHLEVEGIEAATRVGDYPATIQIGGITENAQMVAIDRLEFPTVLNGFEPSWDNGQSLGALMNLLARTPEGVLVSQDVIEQGFEVGDTLPAVVELYGDRQQVSFVIVAAIDLWPGFYPQDGAILVANIDYLFDQMGGRYPYDVWIDRNPSIPLETVVSGARQRGFTVMNTLDTAQMIREEQMHPRRQGVFGLLSVGFIAAGGLTLLGFLLSALITARRRAIEMGVLRALGMSGRQVGVALVIEQVLLVLAGLGSGTGIGLLAAKIVIPLFQVGVGPHPGTPPFAPVIAWEQVLIIYGVFAIALLLTLTSLAVVLGRMKLFQAVKLGDAN